MCVSLYFKSRHLLELLSERYPEKIPSLTVTDHIQFGSIITAKRHANILYPPNPTHPVPRIACTSSLQTSSVSKHWLLSKNTCISNIYTQVSTAEIGFALSQQKTFKRLRYFFQVEVSGAVICLQMSSQIS